MWLSYFIKCEFQREYPPLYNQTISNSNFTDAASPSTIAWWVWVLPTEFLATRLEVHAGMIRYQSFLSMVSLRTSCKRPKFPDEFHRNPDVFSYLEASPKLQVKVDWFSITPWWPWPWCPGQGRNCFGILGLYFRLGSSVVLDFWHFNITQWLSR